MCGHLNILLGALGLASLPCRGQSYSTQVSSTGQLAPQMVNIGLQGSSESTCPAACMLGIICGNGKTGRRQSAMLLRGHLEMRMWRVTAL